MNIRIIRGRIICARFIAGVVLMMVGATGYANGPGKYCLDFPGGGNSIWSKRDNHISLKFKYDLTVMGPDRRAAAEKITRHVDQNGRLIGGWIDFQYGQQRVCLYARDIYRHEQWRINNEESNGVKRFKAGSYPYIENVWANIRHSTNFCKGMAGEFKDYYRIERIWRRKHDHAFPWACAPI